MNSGSADLISLHLHSISNGNFRENAKIVTVPPESG